MDSLSKYIELLKIDLSDLSKTIWCHVRKQWFILTPEEIVRQCVILYCIDKGYPLGRISVEKKIVLNSLNKRYDIVVHDKDGTPFILIECKAMGVPVQQSTLDQAIAYNQVLSSSYIWITNGHENQIYLLNGDLSPPQLQKTIPTHK